MEFIKNGDEWINYIDLEKEVLGSDTQKEEFLKAILFGSSGNPDNFTEIQSRFKLNSRINLKNEGIYDKIKEMKLTEKLGVYYQEEVPEEGQLPGETAGSDVPENNKTLKRVITYSE